MVQTLILVEETQSWYHSELLGLPILGEHTWYHNSPIQPSVVIDPRAFLFLPYLTQIKALLYKEHFINQYFNKTHYDKNLRKIYGPLVVLVDVALLIDIVSDLIQKRKARKAEITTLRSSTKKGLRSPNQLWNKQKWPVEMT